MPRGWLEVELRVWGILLQSGGSRGIIGRMSLVGERQGRGGDGEIWKKVAQSHEPFIMVTHDICD